MNLMIEELYDALRSATGVTDEQARKASTAVADFRSEIADIRRDITDIKSTLRLHNWMLGTIVVLLVMQLAANLTVLYRLAGAQ